MTFKSISPGIFCQPAKYHFPCLNVPNSLGKRVTRKNVFFLADAGVSFAVGSGPINPPNAYGNAIGALISVSE